MITPCSIHLSQQFSDPCPYPSLTTGLSGTFLPHQPEQDSLLEQLCFILAILFASCSLHSWLPISSHPSKSFSISLSDTEPSEPWIRASWVKSQPQPALLTCLMMNWSKHSEVRKETSPGVHLVIFPFSFSLEHLEEGGYLPGNIPCHVFCWKQRAITDLSHFAPKKKTLVQSWPLLEPMPAASYPSLALQDLFNHCAPGGNRIPNQQEPNVGAPELSWRASSQFYRIIAPLYTPLITIKASLGFSQVLQKNSSLNGGHCFWGFNFYLKFHSWENPSLRTQPWLTTPMETQSAEELNSNPVFDFCLSFPPTSFIWKYFNL